MVEKTKTGGAKPKAPAPPEAQRAATKATAGEMLYTIPLKDAWKGAYKRRAKKCMHIIKEFVARHAKAEKIKIGPALNQKIWERGIKSPPLNVRVQIVPHANAAETQEFWVELAGVTLDLEKREEVKKSRLAALKERLAGKKEAAPTEEPAEPTAGEKAVEKTEGKTGEKVGTGKKVEAKKPEG